MELLVLFWVINSKLIKDEFKPIFKREIFSDDFPLLEKHHKLGMDKVLYGRDFKALLLNIRFDPKDLENIDKITFVNSMTKK